jgi:hypothetical protein
MFPRIITLIAEVTHITLPIRLTIVFLFPFMAFFPPIIAIIYGKRIESVKSVFMSCFFSVMLWEIVYLIFIGVILYIPLLEIIRIFLLSVGLGLIGVSRAFAKEKIKHKLELCLMTIGIALWIIGFEEGIIRWFIIVLGGPIPT